MSAALCSAVAGRRWPRLVRSDGSGSAVVAVTLTQVSFSFTSIVATVLIVRGYADPSGQLAFMTGILLTQGLIRAIVGNNLWPGGAGIRGFGWIALLIGALAGFPFVRLGLVQWLIAIVPTATYELGRSTLVRQSATRVILLVALADMLWLLPFAALAFHVLPPVAGLIGTGALLATACLLLSTGFRSSVGHLFGGLRPDQKRLGLVAASFLEGVAGYFVPFIAVSALAIYGLNSDIAALRASAQVMSPIGSLVGVAVIVWPRLDSRQRSVVRSSIVVMPFIAPAMVLLFPRLIAQLTPPPLDTALAYALAWAAFGCGQTILVLKNADHRIGHHGPKRCSPYGIMLLFLCTGSTLIAAGLLDSNVARMVAVSVVLVPWLASVVTYKRVIGAREGQAKRETKSSLC